MKKELLLFLFLLGIGNSIFSLELSGTMWGPERGGHGFYLKFKTGRDFEFVHSGEGGGQNVTGTYVRAGNDITLTTVIINEWGELPAYIKKKTVVCSIKEANSLFAQYKLAGIDGWELWSSSYKPNDGERRILDTIHQSTGYGYGAPFQSCRSALVDTKMGT